MSSVLFFTRVIRSRRVIRLPELAFELASPEAPIAAWAPVPSAAFRRNLTKRKVLVSIPVAEVVAPVVETLPTAVVRIAPLRRQDIERNLVVPYVLPWAVGPPDAYFPAWGLLRASRVSFRRKLLKPLIPAQHPSAQAYPSWVPPKANRTVYPRKLQTVINPPVWPGFPGEDVLPGWLPPKTHRISFKRRLQLAELPPAWLVPIGPAGEDVFPGWLTPKVHRIAFKRRLQTIQPPPVWPSADAPSSRWHPLKALRASSKRRLQSIQLAPVWPAAGPAGEDVLPAWLPPEAHKALFKRRLQPRAPTPILPVVGGPAGEDALPGWVAPKAAHRIAFKRRLQVIQLPPVWPAWGNVENTDFGFSYYLSTSWTASIAALNPVANNGLVVVLATRATRTDINAPEGWTLEDSHDGANPAFYIYSKVATGNEGGEADPIWTFDTDARGFIWSAKLPGSYSGGDIYDTGEYVSGGPVDSSPSITPTDQPGLVFSMLYERSAFLAAGSPTAPTNMTLVKQYEEVPIADEFSLAFKTYDSTDPTGSFTWTGNFVNVSALTFNVFAAGVAAYPAGEDALPAWLPPKANKVSFKRRLQVIQSRVASGYIKPDYPSWEPPKSYRWSFKRKNQVPAPVTGDVWPQKPPGDPRHSQRPFVTRKVASRRFFSVLPLPGSVYSQAIASQFPADIPPKVVKRRDINRRLLTAKLVDGVLGAQATPITLLAEVPRLLRRQETNRYRREVATLEAVLAPQPATLQLLADKQLPFVRQRGITRKLQTLPQAEVFIAEPVQFIPPLLRAIDRHRPKFGPDFVVTALIIALPTTTLALPRPVSIRRRETKRVHIIPRLILLGPQATPSQFPADIPPRSLKRQETRRYLRTSAPVDALLGPQATPSQFPADIPPSVIRRGDVVRRLRLLPTIEGVLGPQATASQLPADIPPLSLKRRDIRRVLLTPKTLEWGIAAPSVAPSQFPADIPPKVIRRRDVARSLIVVPRLEFLADPAAERFTEAIYVRGSMSGAVYVSTNISETTRYLQSSLTDEIYIRSAMSGAVYVRTKINDDDIYLKGEI